jgi:hypothetical protein
MTVGEGLGRLVVRHSVAGDKTNLLVELEVRDCDIPEDELAEFVLLLQAAQAALSTEITWKN